MTTEYNEFISFLENYRDELVIALSNEREKRQALISSDIQRLEAMLQVQQAETMKLKSFENKRMAMQTRMGFENYMARDLISAIDDKEVSRTLGNLFVEIVDLVKRIKQQNKMAIELANTNLHILEKILQPVEREAQSSVYRPESMKNLTYSKGASFDKTV